MHTALHIKHRNGGIDGSSGVPVRDAVKRRLIGFDAVKHLLLARIERRPVPLDLARYPHLPQPFAAATRSADYASLLAGGAGHG